MATTSATEALRINTKSKNIESPSSIRLSGIAVNFTNASVTGLSVVGGGGSITSTALSAVSAQAASAKDVVSARVVSVSAELASLVQVASAAATSANTHAATASAAATSADGHANTVSARVVSVSAELASLLASTSANLKSIIAVSAQTASAAATSADGHANTVSARVVSVSAELASLVEAVSATANVNIGSVDAHAAQASAAATSADIHAAAASAAATSVNAKLLSVSCVSGAGSSKGLQSVVNTLSNRISAIVAGGGISVTSAELQQGLSIVSAQAASAIEAASGVANVNIGSVDAHAAQASAAATSADIHANTVSARAVSISAELASLVQIASAAATSVNSRVNSVNTALSAISAKSVGGVSTHGLQSIINALSNRISAGVGGAGSVTSTELSAVSAQAASAINVVSNKLSVTSTALDGRLTSVSAALASAIITPRVTTITTNATWSPAATDDQYVITAQAADVTTISNPSGTPKDGQKLLIVWKDDGTPRNLTWSGTQWRAALGLSLPTITEASAWGMAGFRWNTQDSMWDLIAVKTTAGGTGSVTSTEMSAVSAQAASAINVVSARVVSVSAELASLLASASANLKSIIGVSAQTASAAATSADGHANTVSARAVSISAELASLVQIASVAATSADGHAAAASAAATSVLNLINAVSTFSGGASIRGVQSIVDSLSARIALKPTAAQLNTVSNAISNEISARQSASAALETHINTVSNALSAATIGGGGSVTSVELQDGLSAVSATANLAIGSVDAHAAQASAAATSADTHANTVSARVVSVSAELASLLASASANLKSIIAVSAQTASAAATSADGHANTVSARAVSISAELASLVQIASAAATSADAHAAAASAAATSVLGVVNAVSTKSAATSTRGLQSVINALSNRISAATGGAGSVTSTELSAAKYPTFNTQTSTNYELSIGDANQVVDMTADLTHQVSVPSNASIAFPIGTQIIVAQGGAGVISVVANAGVTLEGTPVYTPGQYGNLVLIKRLTNTWRVCNSNVAVASALASTADAHANTVSARVVSVSAELASLVQLASVAGTSIANRIQYAGVGGAQTFSTGTLAKVSGLSLSLAQAQRYQVDGFVAINGVGGGSATAVFQMGMSATAQPVYAALRFEIQDITPGAAAGTAKIQYGGESAISATPSIMCSTKWPVSGVAYMVAFDGVIQANAGSNAILKVVAATTTTANGGCTIRAGSYIRAFRISP